MQLVNVWTGVWSVLTAMEAAVWCVLAAVEVDNLADKRVDWGLVCAVSSICSMSYLIYYC